MLPGNALTPTLTFDRSTYLHSRRLPLLSACPIEIDWHLEATRISDAALECALETAARPGLSARITIPMRQACAPHSSDRISMLSINLDDNPTHCDTRLRCDVRVYKYRVIYRCENWTTDYSLLISRLRLSQKIDWSIVIFVHWQEKWFHYTNVRRKCILMHSEEGFFDSKKRFFAVRLKKIFLWVEYIILFQIKFFYLISKNNV